MVERRNAELLNIRRGENILTRAEEVVNDLCKVWVFSHICWAASEQWEEEVYTVGEGGGREGDEGGEGEKTHSSHCSHHSTGLTAFSFTLVWYFSFPNAIVTNASFVPFFPFTFRPFAFFTAKKTQDD